MNYIDRLRNILRDALHLGDRASALTAGSPLLGGIPEFDSMAVLSVITMIEEEFGVQFADDEISGDLFVTLGSLAEFVQKKVESS